MGNHRHLTTKEFAEVAEILFFRYFLRLLMLMDDQRTKFIFYRFTTFSYSLCHWNTVFLERLITECFLHHFKCFSGINFIFNTKCNTTFLFHN